MSKNQHQNSSSKKIFHQPPRSLSQGQVPRSNNLIMQKPDQQTKPQPSKLPSLQKQNPNPLKKVTSVQEIRGVQNFLKRFKGNSIQEGKKEEPIRMPSKSETLNNKKPLAISISFSQAAAHKRKLKRKFSEIKSEMEHEEIPELNEEWLAE